MNMILLFTSLFIIFLTAISFSQKPDTLIKKLDSLNKKTDTSGKQINNINPKAYNEITEINFSSYFILLGSDLKQEITAPFHWSNKAWLKVGGLALIGGALVFADEPLQRHSLQLRNSNKGLAHLSGYVTNFGGSYEVYTLAAFGAYGLIFKSEKVKTTTLLATQAYITGGAMQAFLKFLSGRQRPNFYDPKPPLEAEPKIHGPFSTGKDINGNRLNSSFPSGHTTVAFAAATVYAQ